MKPPWLARVREAVATLAILAVLTLPLVALGALVIPDGCLGRFARAALASPANPQGQKAAVAYCRRNPMALR